MNINPQQIMQVAIEIQKRLQEKNIELNDSTTTVINETLLAMANLPLPSFNGTAIHCEKCNSLHTSYSNVEKEKKETTTVIKYDILCKECNTAGKITEEWNI